MGDNPLAVSRNSRHHCRTHDGKHKVIMIYDGCGQKIRPPISFQVYVTFDISSYTDHELNKLVEKLHDGLLGPPLATEIRLDVTFLGHVPSDQTIDVCITHYRDTRSAFAKDRIRRLVPTYTRKNDQFSGFLLTVPSPELHGEGGVGFLYFDKQVKKESSMDPLYLYPAPLYEDCGYWRDNPWTERLMRICNTIPSEIKKDWTDEYSLVLRRAILKAEYEQIVAKHDRQVT